MRIAFVGTYLPRRCGIGTFTADLFGAVSRLPEGHSCLVVAMNDTAGGYDYSSEVGFEIDQDDPASYRNAAEFLNSSEIDVLSLQHEYGIFGGPEGKLVLELLKNVNSPIVSTLHTVLRDPTRLRRKILKEIARLSDKLVVMGHTGVKFLSQYYGVPSSQIERIPHGVPDAPLIDPNSNKDRFGLSGKFVLMTFGLLGPNKGIECVIDALPRIAAVCPEVVYLVVGETAKYWLDREGESYYQGLQKLVQELGLENNVRFHHEFVSQQELVDRMGAADIYITPYIGEDQIASGTLSYAVGLGKAVISTPYFYAKELLENDRGVLIPFSDPSAISESVIGLIRDTAKRDALRRNAYAFGRHMIWPVVAQSYVKTFQNAHSPKIEELTSHSGASA
jgi:glycosyltransferase involved in cell wall biosynthesis